MQPLTPKLYNAVMRSLYRRLTTLPASPSELEEVEQQAIASAVKILAIQNSGWLGRHEKAVLKKLGYDLNRPSILARTHQAA